MFKYDFFNKIKLKPSLKPSLLGLTILITGLTKLVNPINSNLSKQWIKSTLAASCLETNFTDIHNHPAKPYIKALNEKGIICGYGGSRFHPNKSITRAEFSAIINKAFPDAPVVRTDRANFRDIEPDFWGAGAIQTAYTHGFLSGYEDNTFKPQQNINRTEIVVSLASGLGLESSSNNENICLNRLRDEYEDVGDIARKVNWAACQIEAATRNGIRVLNSKKFRPTTPPASRADVAVFVYQALGAEAAVIDWVEPPSPRHRVSVSLDGGNSKEAERGNALNDDNDRLIIGRNAPESGAGVTFQSGIDQNIIPSTLILAGFSHLPTEYWFPCRNRSGKLLLGWFEGNNSDQCTVARLGETIRPSGVRESIFEFVQGLGQKSLFNSSILELAQGLPNEVLVSPATSETTWIQTEVSDESISVVVLGGIVNITPSATPGQSVQVEALNQYTYRFRDGSFQGVVFPLSLSDRQEIANSRAVQEFLQPQNWSQNVDPTLSQYELLSEAIPLPDLAAQEINFGITRRISEFEGQVEISGVVENVGQGTYRSNSGQPEIQLVELGLGGGSEVVARREFQELRPGESIEVTYERTWNTASPAEGEFPPTYELRIIHSENITQDDNPNNDDFNSNNDQRQRSGAEINELFR